MAGDSNIATYGGGRIRFSTPEYGGDVITLRFKWLLSSSRVLQQQQHQQQQFNHGNNDSCVGSNSIASLAHPMQLLAS